ncbi:hypothetical protein C0989_003891 [Termitomyces sp. Mn162]|nr:hypothetical protein C0989_003891 [Termitomyces sp. Mn162]
MATKCERDISPTPDDSDLAPWEFDPAFNPPPGPPPRFVPAAFTGLDRSSDNRLASSSKRAETLVANDVSNWYRSLTSRRSINESNAQPRPSSLPPDGQNTQPQFIEKSNKNNWFILNAIHSNPEAQPTGKASPSTLVDIIARDPPPHPGEKQFKPPIWLGIGPSNRGFAMLRRSGWSEGEPLGLDVVRRPHFLSDTEMIDLGKRKEKYVFIKQEIIEVDMDGHDDVTELRQVNIIDLTTDGDDESLPPPGPTLNAEGEARPEENLSKTSNDDYGRTALLTPIATVLKSDRLGIGLKAKSVGPYKASQKRVTHNAAAFAAHMRAAEESHRKKKLFGRGSRGFSIQQKTNESDRKRLLAYLNG